MRKPVAEEPSVQVELSLAVLRRLLRERSLVASELRYLNSQSCRAARAALLAALTAGGAEHRAREHAAESSGFATGGFGEAKRSKSRLYLVSENFSGRG
tara:strand:- start:14923 stop:15219 length:297 start_codon:yes stop_codon:yes gene_type:complete